MPQPIKILIVDDEVNMLESLSEVLRNKGYLVATARNGLEALEKLKEKYFNIAIADLKMPEMGGMELLEVMKERYPQTPLVMLTGYATINSAVDAMKKGAYDYLVKPFSPDKILLIAKKIMEEENLREENRFLRQELEKKGEIITQNQKMRRLKDLMKRVASTQATVLITGETGTGKELVARGIHRGGSRKRNLFVKVNCAALAEGVLESELFGHERGAFTDAYIQRRGRFELADGGTLFLDEIGDIPLATQAKLLRVLQEGEFERVGGEETIKVDVRIVAATNQSLPEAIKEKRFREDLFYRLNVVSIDLPPLRERKEDIPLLAQYFLKKHRVANRRVEGISKKALDQLTSYPWPGNVRELENTMERTIILAKRHLIEEEDLSLPSRNTVSLGNL
ncbi:sigma-54-dependent Fis family transcriptional regulator, partial [Candidatus Aerophobetes bacterium]